MCLVWIFVCLCLPLYVCCVLMGISYGVSTSGQGLDVCPASAHAVWLCLVWIFVCLCLSLYVYGVMMDMGCLPPAKGLVYVQLQLTPFGCVCLCLVWIFVCLCTVKAPRVTGQSRWAPALAHRAPPVRRASVPSDAVRAAVAVGETHVRAA